MRRRWGRSAAWRAGQRGHWPGSPRDGRRSTAVHAQRRLTRTGRVTPQVPGPAVRREDASPRGGRDLAGTRLAAAPRVSSLAGRRPAPAGPPGAARCPRCPRVRGSGLRRRLCASPGAAPPVLPSASTAARGAPCPSQTPAVTAAHRTCAPLVCLVCTHSAPSHVTARTRWLPGGCLPRPRLPRRAPGARPGPVARRGQLTAVIAGSRPTGPPSSRFLAQTGSPSTPRHQQLTALDDMVISLSAKG